MTQDKNIIYVNGDSFTEGSDMADHMYPFFKRYYSLNEITSEDIDIRLSNQRASVLNKSKFHRTSDDRQLIDKINRFQTDNRWSTVLSKLLNRPVYNISSHGGSSMYAIAYRTIADLYRLQQEGFTITDTVIQVTGAHRYSFFAETNDEEEPQRDSNIRYYHIRTGNPLSPNRINTELLQAISLEESVEMAEYRWLHDVCMLKNAIENLTKSRVIFVDSVFYLKQFNGLRSFDFSNSPWLNKNPTDYVLNFKKILDNEMKLTMLNCIGNNEPDTITDGMHFTAPVHDKFAQQIARTYFNE